MLLELCQRSYITRFVCSSESPEATQKTDWARVRGKAYKRKSRGALLKLRIDIPTTEALEGLKQSKFLAISRRGRTVYWLKYKYKALHLNSPGTSDL